MRNRNLTIRYVVIAIAITIITSSYWFMADPPSPWIFAIAAAGILVSVVITNWKTRHGHF